MRRLYSILLLILAASPLLFARPSRGGRQTVSQPDGTRFTLISYGDEFNRIRKTEDGLAVVRGEDGWWYYQLAEFGGERSRSDIRVGQSVPDDVRIASLEAASAPSKVAQRKRAVAKRIIEQDGRRTRMAEGDVKHKGIVLLVAFKDVSFKYTRQDFVNLLTQKGYSRNGATGSAKEYFEAQFGEGSSFDFDVSEIVTLKENRAFYGSNTADDQDKAPEKMVQEACKLASEGGVDFSQYDYDGDGEVDIVFVFFAGEDEADFPDGSKDDCVWAHAWYLWDGAGIRQMLNGKLINRYACAAELMPDRSKMVISGIGTFCHEFSHTLGLPDYYDTDYELSGGVAAAMWGQLAVMDDGGRNNNCNTPPYFSSIDRELLGISEPKEVSEAGHYRLSPISDGGQALRIATDHPDEYYLLECRDNSGWDSYLPGRGLLVYHIDRSKRAAGNYDDYGNLNAFQLWNEYNLVNANPAHQCADLIEAAISKDRFNSFDSYRQSAYTSNLADLFFPAKGKNSLEFSCWSKNKDFQSPLVSGIKFDGKDIVLNISGPKGPLPKPVVESCSVFQDAAYLRFSCEKGVWDGIATVKWNESGKDFKLEVEPYGDGLYCAVIEGLNPNWEYTVELSLGTDKTSGEKESISFRTKAYNADSYVYICLEGAARNSDGSFKKGCTLPLRAYNAVGASSVKWYFNGARVTLDADAYFRPQSNGELKADVIWKDGSRDSIRKSIIIK